MYIQTVTRCGAALFLLLLIGGCSSSGGKAAGQGSTSTLSWDDNGVLNRDDQCRRSRKACIFEGAYEPGERNYAVAEAKRLNQASLARLRRGLGN